MSTVYKIHRRINAPLSFKGLKGQYIFLAGATIVADLFLFAILYIAGVSNWICLLLCLGVGVFGIGGAYRSSHQYGVHGWRKRRMAKKMPAALRCDSRRLFLQLKSFKK